MCTSAHDVNSCQTGGVIQGSAPGPGTIPHGSKVCLVRDEAVIAEILETQSLRAGFWFKQLPSAPGRALQEILSGDTPTCHRTPEHVAP